MPGRKPQDKTRRLPVKNLYLPHSVVKKIDDIALTVTNSAMDVYTQSVRSFFARYRAEYLSWVKADWELSGLTWSDYVDGLLERTLDTNILVPYRPSPLRDLAPITVQEPTTINSMLLPVQTIFLVRAAARRDAIALSRLVSYLIVWHIDNYWDSNYVPLMMDVHDFAFIADAAKWSDQRCQSDDWKRNSLISNG
jgi:hypothetical protein